jgi:hypothetical protein
MKDKEKQIEEMGKDVCENINSKMCADGTCPKIWDCPYSNTMAEILIEKGYRKLPEDSVVLSEEDKAKLIHINTLKNIKSISQLKELLSNITAINDLMGYNDRELEIRQEANKETAEKIMQDLKPLLEGFVHTDTNENLYIYKCKQFGVEIKE